MAALPTPKVLPRPSVPIRIYLNAINSSLVTGAEHATQRVTRHDAVLLIALDGKQFRVEAGNAHFQVQAAAIAPSAGHLVHPDGCRMVRLAVHPIHPMFGSLRGHLTDPATPVDPLPLAAFQERLNAAYVGNLDAWQAATLIEDLITLLLADAAHVAPLDKRIVSILRKIGTHLDYPFETLAEETGLSPSRLSHLFTEHLGVSFRGCQAWIRMVQAWTMVTQQHDMSLTQVAHALKFSDSSHLSRALKRRHGMTPTMFRDPHMVEIIRTPEP